MSGKLREIESKTVMYIETTDIPDGIANTFTHLESRLPTLRQRKFYGVMFGNKYWAAVELKPQDDPTAMKLKVGKIPGGVYICTKLKDWRQESLANDIPQTFNEITMGKHVDPTRPFVEFYRSQQELILYAPVRTE